MSNRIEKIDSLSYNPTPIEPLRRYTKKELKAKLKQIQIEQDEFYEIKTYLAQFKNPDNLSFKELIELKDKSPDEQDYILDISSLK